MESEASRCRMETFWYHWSTVVRESRFALEESCTLCNLISELRTATSFYSK